MGPACRDLLPLPSFRRCFVPEIPSGARSQRRMRRRELPQTVEEGGARLAVSRLGLGFKVWVTGVGSPMASGYGGRFGGGDEFWDGAAAGWWVSVF
jgi:hypothetical protein